MHLLVKTLDMEDKRTIKNTILSDMKTAFRPPLFFAIVGVVLCFCIDNWGDLVGSFHNPNLYSEYSVTCVHYFFFNSISFGGVFMGYLSCMLSAVPFATNYSHEFKGGITIYRMTRCGRKVYAQSKILTSALSGGLVMILGGSIFILILSTYLPLVTPSKLIEAQEFPYYSALSVGNGIPYFIIILYILFLSGAFWSSVGMCISAYYPNPCVAVCSPMIVRFLLVEVGRLAKLPAALRVDKLLNASAVFFSEPITLITLTLLVIFICWICFTLFYKRVAERLEDDGRC